MLLDMNRRYQFIINPSATNFDPLYVTSTLLNPPYIKILNNVQELKAKIFLLELMINSSGSELTQSSHSSNQNSITFHDGSDEQVDNTIDRHDGEELPMKCFKHLDRVSKLLERELSDQEDDMTQISMQEHQINDYMKSKTSKEGKRLDPYDYWIKKKNDYPCISQVACEILATPASTALVERIFSSGGEVTRGKRNRLADKHLEREIFLRRNKKYIGIR